MRKFLATLALVALVAVAAIVGATIGANRQAATDSHADITAISCSAYASTSHPKIPPYTFTGACVLPDGTLSTPTDPTGAADIPRCVNDDYNDGSQDLCWTERATDGAYLVIDRSDRVVSTTGN